MKKLWFFMALCATLIGFTSCDSDDDRKPEMEDFWLLPSENFGASLTAIASAETSRGFTASTTDNVLTVTKTVEGVPFVWKYIGDADGNYRYAMCNVPTEYVAQLKALLISKKGYVENASYSLNADYTVFCNTTNETFATFYNGDGAYFLFGPYDESLYSWTRLSLIREETGLLLPFLGYGADVTLLKHYAARAGYTEHKNTDESRGFYFYETHNDTYPAVAYWFDEETKTQLVEARLYFDGSNMPSIADVKAAMKDIGYDYTYSLDPNDESQIFFDYENKKTIYVAYDKPEGYEGTFLPCIKFTNVTVENNIPPKEVNFPWLPIKVYDMTIDEAIAWVQSQSWCGERDADYFGIWPMFKTNIPEFPLIVLMDDDGTYAAGIVFAETSLVLRALSIRDTIENVYKCVYKEGSSLYPTFLSTDSSLEVPYEFQYIYDAGMWGYPALVVEPQ